MHDTIIRIAHDTVIQYPRGIVLNPTGFDLVVIGIVVVLIVGALVALGKILGEK